MSNTTVSVQVSETKSTVSNDELNKIVRNITHRVIYSGNESRFGKFIITSVFDTWAILRLRSSEFNYALKLFISGSICSLLVLLFARVIRYVVKKRHSNATKFAKVVAVKRPCRACKGSGKDTLTRSKQRQVITDLDAIDLPHDLTVMTGFANLNYRHENVFQFNQIGAVSMSSSSSSSFADIEIAPIQLASTSYYDAILRPTRLAPDPPNSLLPSPTPPLPPAPTVWACNSLDFLPLPLPPTPSPPPPSSPRIYNVPPPLTPTTSLCSTQLTLSSAEVKLKSVLTKANAKTRDESPKSQVSFQDELEAAVKKHSAPK